MPKKEFTNFKDLLNGVEEELADSLDKEVAEKIKQKISASAKKNVILQTPGRAVGGIDDVSQMKDRVERKKRTMTLTVTDVAKPSPSIFGTKFDTAKDSAVGGTMFANWIEHGYWVDLKALLDYRMGKWAWQPNDSSWGDMYDPDLARTEGKYGAMTKKDRDYSPRREPRPFIAPVQEEINMKPEEIISLLRKRFE